MAFLPIKLSAVRGNWQRYQARKRNKRFLAAQEKVFARDKHTCRYCGFFSEKYHTVINHDQNYANNKASNLVTACSLCAQCFFLDSIGRDNKTGGFLIYLPEVSQSDLNHFCRVLFSSMLRDAPYRGKLQSTYLSLKDRTSIIDELFGPDSHDPNIFGQTLIDSNLSDKIENNPVVEHLRLLPNRSSFKEEAYYWKTSVFDQIPL